MDIKFEKIGFFIWALMILLSILEGSILLTLISLLFGWAVPLVGVMLDIVNEEDLW